jgi:hypothetical protein
MYRNIEIEDSIVNLVVSSTRLGTHVYRKINIVVSKRWCTTCTTYIHVKLHVHIMYDDPNNYKKIY